MATTENQSPVSGRTYDWLKSIAQIILPALGTMYFGIAEIWHLPFGPEVVGTITVVDLFLGVVLSVLAKQYYQTGSNFDGQLQMVKEDDGHERYVFKVDSDPETVVKAFGKRTFEFRVNDPVVSTPPTPGPPPDTPDVGNVR